MEVYMLLNGMSKLNSLKNLVIIFAFVFLLMMIPMVILSGDSADAAEEEGVIGTVEDITQDGSDVYVDLSTGEGIKLTFLKDNLFRFHLDPEKEFPATPEPNDSDHTTTIIDKNESEYKEEYGLIDVTIEEDDEFHKISTDVVELRIDKTTSKMSLYDKNNPRFFGKRLFLLNMTRIKQYKPYPQTKMNIFMVVDNKMVIIHIKMNP